MNVDDYAKIIWNYQLMHHTIERSDCIVVLGSNDTRTSERGAELYLKGLAPVIVFSGGLGRLTKGIWERPEARIFAEVAMKLGVPGESIIIEDQSTNTGENICFTKEILFQRGINPRKIIAVQKPYMERRTYAAIRNFWPEVDVLVTSPKLTYEEYCYQSPPGGLTREDILNIVIGDLDRIRVYPEKGFQICQEIPKEVLNAFEYLVGLGYDKYLVK